MTMRMTAWCLVFARMNPFPGLSNVQRNDERVRHPRVGTGRLLRLNSIAEIGRPPVSAVDELRPFARHERNFRPILKRHRGVVSARYRAPCDSVLREGCRRTALSVGVDREGPGSTWKDSQGRTVPPAPAAFGALGRPAPGAVRQAGRAVVKHSVVQHVPVAAKLQCRCFSG